MTITVHLVRHAQGFHNLNVPNQQIPDPYLTATGKEQCAALRASFPHHDRLTHLVASPMRRTLQTCEQSFRPAVEAGLKVVAQPLVQEVSTLPCDTGSEPEVLAAEFGAWADLSGVPKGWNDKTSAGSPWAPRIEALEGRARIARVWLRDLGRKWKAEGRGDTADIVVTTHGGFLHFLTQDWDGLDLTKGTGWVNTEYRSYEFDNPEGDDSEARIHETKPSWRRRRGSAIGLTSTEQQQLRAVFIEAYRKEFGDASAAAAE
ncbi:hypothetical protein INS49_009613 [Diaporthe citri]|uniref:uncharacterized protein n=1 Tax=Diaporthe citri TaxID=83186 RepID=UPI001C8210C5|nr:uncharacterized protein INS49_009613 [Diaporthe citri]KAG6361386.1 hypothetical protein INS49_009613 [Diaporthe citri]